MSRFTITRVLDGPADLRAPVAAAVVEVQFGPDGQTYFCCRLDEPVRFDPTVGSDPAIDALGDGTAAAMVHEIVFRSVDPAQHPHPGMRGFLVEVFYVIDPDFDASKELDFNTIVRVASAEIDALDEGSTPAVPYMEGNAASPARPGPAVGASSSQFSVDDLEWDTGWVGRPTG